MCLQINTKINNKQKAIDKYKKIAKKDLTVYKVFREYRGKFYSPFRSTRYDIGYHYYQTDNKFTFKFFYSMGNRDYKLNIERGLHAYTSISKCYNHMSINYNSVIVQCTMPKGSEYFVSSWCNEIVSDNLILEKILEYI